MSDKDQRVYYQQIVYHVCNVLDAIDGRKPGTGITCDQVKGRMDSLQSLLEGYREALKACTCANCEAARKDPKFQMKTAGVE